MDGKISEQRVYYKIRAQLGFPPTEIHADLQKAYGNGAKICYSLQVDTSQSSPQAFMA